MFSTKPTQAPMYRWRYAIGYSIFVILLAAVLLLAGFFIPGSISAPEESSLIASATIPFNDFLTINPVNIPYYLLQLASLKIFSVTLLGIKLPSLLFGLLSAIALIFLLKRWYKSSIAILSTVIAITTSQFIFLAQQGSPAILYIFWPTVILLMATLSARKTSLQYVWFTIGIAAAALSLYTPLSAYVLLAIISAIILHPHLRYLMRNIPVHYVATAAALATILLAPLAVALIKNPATGLVLLGIPSSVPDIMANINYLCVQYFGFYAKSTSSLLLPLFSLSSMLIIFYGIWAIRKRLATVQGYLIVIWSLLLLIPLVLNPEHTSIVFVPMTLLLANGLSQILRRWYTIFPFNPYARIAGLFTLTMLISIMVIFGIERYTQSYRYAPTVLQHLSRDTVSIPETDILIVAPEEKRLYSAVAHFKPELTVRDSVPEDPQMSFVTTRAARIEDRIPSSIYIAPTKSQSDRFYRYEPSAL